MKSKAVAVNTGADNFDLREINDEKLENINKNAVVLIHLPSAESYLRYFWYVLTYL